MEKVDFIQKPIELAQSSQYLIENLWEIGTEISKLYASLPSFISSFVGFLVYIIDYQSKLNKSIHWFTLTRFDLLSPYALRTEGLTQRGGGRFSAETGKLMIPFRLNLSIVRAVSNLALPPVEETSEPVLFSESQEPEIRAKVFDRDLAEAPQATLVQRVAKVQTQLLSRATQSVKNLSSTLLEYERRAIPLAFLTAASKPVLLSRTGFAGFVPYRFVAPLEDEQVTAAPSESFVITLEDEKVKAALPNPFAVPLEEEKVKAALSEPFVAPLEEEKLKATLPEPSSKKVTRETQLDTSLRKKAKPSDITGGITLNPETLMVVGYAATLSKAISEKQTSFPKIGTSIAQISSAPIATSPSIEPSQRYVANAPEEPTQSSASFTSWIHKESETLLRTQGSLLALSVAASTAEKLVTETLTRPISSMEAPPTYKEQEITSQSLTPTKLKPEAKTTPVEAFRIPSILTSYIANYSQMYPWISTEPAVDQIYETPVEVEQFTSEKLKAPSEISDAQNLSKLPIALALAATGKLLTQRRRQESAAFLKKIQISWSTYARLVADLGAAGPIRATMLDEIAAGITIPYGSEPYPASAETAVPYSIEPFPSTAQPVSSQLRRRITTSQNTINVKVFADTTEDLRDLEGKIRRILSEQVADLDVAGSIRTTVLDELAAGIAVPYTIETYPASESSVSQQPLRQSSISPVRQDTISVNVFADTPEEDLRELERKIRRILSEQVSRYYGSSKI